MLHEGGRSDGDVELIHAAEPIEELRNGGAYQLDDGKWVYRKLPARALWDQIMRSTYDHAEPGILFLDRMNQDNNLHYCETIEATNPCAEQPLPPTAAATWARSTSPPFVTDAFSDKAAFNFDGFGKVVDTAIRMLDNVLDITHWPLNEQEQEAQSKRRVGLGFTGLGDA